jgi:hypothetical protein
VAQVVECLFSKHEALSSNASATKNMLNSGLNPIIKKEHKQNKAKKCSVASAVKETNQNHKKVLAELEADTLTMTILGEEVEKLKPSYICGGNVN